MPRTSAQPKSAASQAVTEAEFRAKIEKLHWKQQERPFRYPLQTWPPTTLNDGDIGDTKRRILWQHNGVAEHTDKLLDQLTPEESRMYCFKDCALYVVTASISRRWWRLQLYDKIYRYWFPSRAEDVDISHGAFFCHISAFRIPVPLLGIAGPTSLTEVLSYHRTLCAQLGELVPAIPKDIPYARALTTPPAVYELRPTFKECFLVIHAEEDDHSIESETMKARGVTIVWLDKQAAERHGCVPNEAEGISVEATEDLGDAQAYRCDSVECAMRVVLSTDPQRSALRKECHGKYREPLDQNAPSAIEFCDCLGCQEGRSK